MTKVCTKCGIEQSIKTFSIQNRLNYRYRNNICKECQNKASLER